MRVRPDGPPAFLGVQQSLRLWGARAISRVLLIAPIFLTACQPAILDPQGPIGLADRTILIDSLAIMLAIVIPTIAATFGFAWWFRASNTRATYLPDFEYSGRLELIARSLESLFPRFGALTVRRGASA